MINNLENLFELKKQKESLIETFKGDHDWEIGYQKYYKFLVQDFYNFLKNILGMYGKKQISQINNLEGLQLKVLSDGMIDNFICEFVKFYQLGTISYGKDEKENYTLIIDFENISLERVIICFYDELQRIEMTMKSKEEMERELEHFRENKDWLLQKQMENELESELNSIIDDSLYTEYYNSLRLINNQAYSYIDDLMWENNYGTWDAYKSFCLKNVNYETYELILTFLKDYQLGECRYEHGIVFVNLNREFETVKKVKEAYYMEIQRLEYLREENKLKR